MGYSDLVLGDSPVWYARLGESSGMAAVDEVAAFNGTYQNTPTLGVTGAISGDSDTGITLTAASNEYISIPDDAKFDFGNADFSLEIWAKLSSSGLVTRWLISKKDQFNWLINSAGKLKVDNFSGSADYISTATVNGDANWHHYVVTRSSGTWTFYRDGAVLPGSGTGTITPAANSAPVYIGTESDDFVSYFDGSFDEPAIYGAALTATQVLDHYLAGVGTGILARGTGARNTGSESSYVITPGSAFSGRSGAIAILAVAYDNSGTSGADPYSSIADSNGNTWTPRQNALNDPGAANAGSTLRIFTTDMANGTLDTSDTITVSFGSTTVARAYALWEVVRDGYSVAYGTGAVETATTASPTITTSSIASGGVVIGAMGRQGNDSHTQDTDTSNGTWSAPQASGVGTTTSGHQIASQGKVTTGTATQTYNPTFGASRDGCEAWISLTLTAADITVTPSTKSLTATKYAPIIALGIIPSTEALSLATFAPVVGLSIIPGTTALTLTTYAPTVSATAHQTATPSTASLSLSAYAPVLRLVVTPDTQAVALTALPPIITASDHQAVTPSPASLDLMAFSPAVATSDATVAEPATAALELTAFAPGVVLTDHRTVTPATAALSLTAFAPTVVASDHRTVTPSTASLSMTAFAATVTASDQALRGSLSVSDAPTGGLSVSDAPTGGLSVSDAPTGGLSVSDAPTGGLSVSDAAKGGVTVAHV